jgi:phospholipase/lecithinase/hemolysin
VQEEVFDVVSAYNSLLRTGFEEFKRNKTSTNGKDGGVRIWLFNTTGVFDRVLDDPEAYGAPDATCYNGNGVSCLWWNDFHPGQTIHNVLASAVANLTGF